METALNKKVLVSTYDGEEEVLCSAHIHILHDKEACQGSISLRIKADLANSGGRSRLILNVPPASVEECVFSRTSSDGVCSSHSLNKLPRTVNSALDVSTWTLKLGTNGIIFCPLGMDILSPADPKDSNFRGFVNACKSKFLRLHFLQQQFGSDQLAQLENFSSALQKGNLQAAPFRHDREGMAEIDLRAFDQSLDPPPYSEEAVSDQTKQVNPPLYHEELSSEQVVGKRRRDQWSSPPDNEIHKRLRPPSPQLLGSPTEVNTPSTLSMSPSIRPTRFTYARSLDRKDSDTLARLRHELRDASDDFICKLLIQSGRQHLLARLGDGDSGPPFDVTFKRHLDHSLKEFLKELVNRAASECRDQIFDEYKTNEVDFREQVDDFNSEIRITAIECMKEMNEQAQNHMHEMEEQAHQCMNDIENQGIKAEMAAEEMVTKSQHWLNASAQFLPDSKSSPSQVLDSNSRRRSI